MKKILWVLLAVLLVMGLAACGAEDTPETTAPPYEVEIPYTEAVMQRPYEGVELTFRAIWKKNDPKSRVLTQAAELFERTTGAKVKISRSKDKEADLMQVSAENFAAMPVEEMLDLTDLAKQAGYEGRSYKALRTQIVSQCGVLSAVPQIPYLGGIYYNSDVFTNCGITRMPHTWEEFVSVCEILRGNGWSPLTLDNEDAVTAMELYLRRIIGDEEMAHFMTKDAHWHFDQRIVAAMEQVRLFVADGNMTYGTPAESPIGQNKMGISNSAMMVGTNADCAAVEQSTLTDLNWGVFPFPGTLSSGTWASADMLVIDPNCENPQAAFDFMMLLVTGEFDQLRVDISGGIPADPTNHSPIAGAAEALDAAPPEPLGVFGEKQTDAAVKLWSGWYAKASSYAVALERSK